MKYSLSGTGSEAMPSPTMAISRWQAFKRRRPPAEKAPGDDPVDEETKLGYLTQQAIFRDLPPADIERISKMTHMVTARKGQIFYVPGETGEVLFLLKKGKVELYRLTPDGRKLLVDIVGPGTFFGDMACIGQRMQDSFAESAEDALICVMSRHDVERLLLDKPRVALRILELVGQRYVDMTTRLEESAFRGANERVASLLLRLATWDQDQLVAAGYSHQDLAYMLGMYRETVTNALDQLKAERFIEVGRKRVVLLDPEHLRGLVEEGQ